MTNQNLANIVISVLNEMNVDGETMEHIINQVGMREQMINQLYLNKVPSQNDDNFRDGIYTFTEGELLEYTRQIVIRCKDAAMEAVKDAAADFEYHTELELNDKEISLSFDERGIYDEINNNIDNVIDTDDDDSIKDEMSSVLRNM
jgi:hypothetical protein